MSRGLAREVVREVQTDAPVKPGTSLTLIAAAQAGYRAARGVRDHAAPAEPALAGRGSAGRAA
jgi:hypothetical protein